MEPPSHENPSSAPEKSKTKEVLALASSPKAGIETRHRLPGSRLGAKHTILDVEGKPVTDSAGKSLATRRHKLLRRRRQKRLLMAFAVILGLFPPMWAVYLIAWLIWRSRPPQQSMRKVRKGIKALENGHTGVALKQFQEAHFLNPSNNDALYWLGLLLSRQNRHDEAAEALSLVSERVPGLPEVESALVEAYVATNEPEGAVYHAQRLLDVAPYALETLLKLADAYEAAGQLDLAIEALKQAPLHKPTLTEALLRIHYRLGLLYELQGNADQALHHFKLVYARDITYKDIRTRVQKLETE